VQTDVGKSERVWKGFVGKTGELAARMFYLAFATADDNIELCLYRYLRKVFDDATGKFHKNLLDDDAFTIYRAARRVRTEIHRFHGFVRFQATADGKYFAVIAPDNDIVSLLAPFFTARFPAQNWVIYDSKRNKGIFYDCKNVVEIQLAERQFSTLTGNLRPENVSDDENRYRQLWRTYYRSINIVERKNTRTMVNFLPRRYWKYLTEKN
jgi:probable DNA metabolism protein